MCVKNLWELGVWLGGCVFTWGAFIVCCFYTFETLNCVNKREGLGLTDAYSLFVSPTQMGKGCVNGKSQLRTCKLGSPYPSFPQPLSVGPPSTYPNQGKQLSRGLWTPGLILPSEWRMLVNTGEIWCYSKRGRSRGRPGVFELGAEPL
jgi:hypothetical protein